LRPATGRKLILSPARTTFSSGRASVTFPDKRPRQGFEDRRDRAAAGNRLGQVRELALDGPKLPLQVIGSDNLSLIVALLDRQVERPLDDARLQHFGSGELVNDPIGDTHVDLRLLSQTDAPRFQ
jgi:hypothetical protein